MRAIFADGMALANCWICIPERRCARDTRNAESCGEEGIELRFVLKFEGGLRWSAVNSPRPNGQVATELSKSFDYTCVRIVRSVRKLDR